MKFVAYYIRKSDDKVLGAAAMNSLNKIQLINAAMKNGVMPNATQIKNPSFDLEGLLKEIKKKDPKCTRCTACQWGCDHVSYLISHLIVYHLFDCRNILETQWSYTFLPRLFVLGVMLEEVLCDVVDGVLGFGLFLGEGGEGLENEGNHWLVEVRADGDGFEAIFRRLDREYSTWLIEL